MSAWPLCKRGQQGGEGDRLVDELEAQAVAESFRQIDVEADVLAGIVRIERLIAGGMRVVSASASVLPANCGYLAWSALQVAGTAGRTGSAAKAGWLAASATAQAIPASAPNQRAQSELTEVVRAGSLGRTEARAATMAVVLLSLGAVRG